MEVKILIGVVAAIILLQFFQIVAVVASLNPIA